MKFNTTTWLYIGVAIVVIGLVFYATQKNKPVDPAVVGFAQCLTEDDVTFYGAWWCPHCGDQKDLFGSAMSEINYVECSSPGSQSMNQTCRSAGIKSYPTWEFSDGSRVSGVQSFDALAAKSNCEAPSTVEADAS